MHSSIGSLDKVSTVSSLITHRRPSLVRVAWLKSTPPGTGVGGACCFADLLMAESRECIEDMCLEEMVLSDIFCINFGKIDATSSTDMSGEVYSVLEK